MVAAVEPSTIKTTSQIDSPEVDAPFDIDEIIDLALQSSHKKHTLGRSGRPLRPSLSSFDFSDAETESEE